MKLEFSRQIFGRYPNIKFHENPSSESLVPCGRTDRHDKLIDAFFSFANAPSNTGRLSEVLTKIILGALWLQSLILLLRVQTDCVARLGVCSFGSSGFPRKQIDVSRQPMLEMCGAVPPRLNGLQKFNFTFAFLYLFVYSIIISVLPWTSSS